VGQSWNRAQVAAAYEAACNAYDAAARVWCARFN
jgi:hypothetical protein